MSISQRHHYLPQFYLKGFTGTDGKLAVYDLGKGRLQKQRFSTSQVFFEWNRNTLLVHGKEDDFLEKLYQSTEDKAAPIFKEIQEQKGRVSYSVLDMLQILMFVSQTYWRIPRTDNDIENHVKGSTPEQLHFKVTAKDSQEEASKEFYEKLLNNPVFIQMYRLMKPMVEYSKSNPFEYIKNCKISYSATDVELHLIGDNPTIFKDDNKTNIYQDEFIFPISKGKTLYHTKGQSIKELPPEHTLKVDLLLFLQSSKYVCGTNGDYIQAIADMAKIYTNPLHKERLKKQVFSVFE